MRSNSLRSLLSLGPAPKSCQVFVAPATGEQWYSIKPLCKGNITVAVWAVMLIRCGRKARITSGSWSSGRMFIWFVSDELVISKQALATATGSASLALRLQPASKIAGSPQTMKLLHGDFIGRLRRANRSANVE
ncbi:MAG TPA: hypothetical protein VFE51_20600 [Verrucomicrobiae bacterium]|nr:hypothetical protein [Verrucomicrobiae bacterium]